jgi:hypothetical protein
VSLRRSDEGKLSILAVLLLAGMPRISEAQTGASPWTSRISVGAGIGPTVRGANPFEDLGDCGSSAHTDVGSAAINVGLRFSRWLSLEATSSRHFLSAPLLCPLILRSPRPTGADTLSSGSSPTYPGRELRAFGVRLSTTPFTWRRVSASLVAGIAHVEPRGRHGPTLGAAVATGSRVQLRLDLEHWFMPASRDVHDIFYMDGREVGRRDRVERIVAQPTFIRLGIQIRH